jgi:hypothetical protein
MGTCSYYRRFIKDFAAIARPMHKLTEKNCPFNWTEECETAFQKCVQEMKLVFEIENTFWAKPSTLVLQFCLELDLV